MTRPKPGQQLLAPLSRSLDTKGVNYGLITAGPDGSVDTSKVRGVDADLVIKPFHRKGMVDSVRVFTINPFNDERDRQRREAAGEIALRRRRPR